MTTFNPAGLRTYGSMQGIRWWYNRLVKKGIVPAFSREELEKAAPLPANHPYLNKKLHIIPFIGILLFIALFVGIPFAFYFLQRALFMSKEMMLMNNSLSAVLTIFPSMLLSFWVLLWLSIKAREKWPDYGIISAYKTIIGANATLHKEIINASPWERLIKPEHVHKVLAYEDHFFQKITLWIFLICLPLYAMLLITYTSLSAKGVTETFIGSKNEFTSTDATRVSTQLRFVEEKNDYKYELRPKLAVEVFYKDGRVYNMCQFVCSENGGTVLSYIYQLKTTQHVALEVSPLKEYEAELLQKTDPETYRFYTKLLELSK